MSNLTAILHELLGVKPKRTEPALTCLFGAERTAGFGARPGRRPRQP